MNNKNLAKKGTIIALALAVVIGMSYFSSQDYLNMSIMDMLIGATTSGCPNPNGSKGGTAHQNKIQDVISAIQGRNNNYQTEYRVDTPNGEKSYRRVDVAELDQNDNVIKHHQVGRQNQNGSPFARERRAKDDIEAASGKTVEFHAYNLPSSATTSSCTTSSCSADDCECCDGGP